MKASLKFKGPVHHIAAMRLPMSLHVATVVVCTAALAVTARTADLEARAITDPVARVDLALDTGLTSHTLVQEIDEALQGGDLELADSFVDLAQERGFSVPQDRMDRLAALRDDTWGRAARDFKDGFTQKDVRSGMGMSGAIAADLSGFGDLRDLASEGGKWMKGQDTDTLVLGLSAAGLAVTAVTWSSLGAALPARVGLSLTKSLQKSGRLSPPLARSLARVTGEALDRDALSASLASLRRLDFSAARASSARLLRPAALTELRQIGTDVSVLYSKTGVRGAQEVLSLAASPVEIRAAARIATAKGAKTLAVLKIFGRGVLIAGSLGLTLAGWLLTFMVWAFAAASFARRLGERIGRRLFAPWAGSSRR